MPFLFNSLVKNGLNGIGKTIVGEKPASDTRDPIDMKASVFFDGTFNNRTNVSLRLANLGQTKVAHGTESVRVGGPRSPRVEVRPKIIDLTGNSYSIFYSNVAILEYMNDIQDEDKQVSVYVEGIGTNDYEVAQMFPGGAAGSGPTGIPAKVTRGIILLHEKIQQKLGKDKRLRHLQVDVYGFSRGSAAARHFVARRTNEFLPRLINLAQTLGVEPSAVSVNFVGLFDTVSSYLGMNSDLLKFFNNVEELHLNIASNAKHVVQLGAGNEYRAKYSMTNIDSSIQAGTGYQCIILGDHRDVGGSHVEGEIDKTGNILESEREELVNGGWFTAEQLPPVGPPPPPVYYPSDAYGGAIPMYSPAVTRGSRTIKAGYQFIPLSLMIALSKKFNGLPFKSFSGQLAKYKVPQHLQPLYSLMRTSVVDEEKTHFVLPHSLHWVRNQYLHRSADDTFLTSFASGTRRVNGRPEREIISDAS